MVRKAASLAQLERAFDAAETQTADAFLGATAALKTTDGSVACAICYFRAAVVAHLGMRPAEPDASDR